MEAGFPEDREVNSDSGGLCPGPNQFSPWRLPTQCGGGGAKKSALTAHAGRCHQPAHEPSASRLPSPRQRAGARGLPGSGTVASCTRGPRTPIPANTRRVAPWWRRGWAWRAQEGGTPPPGRVVEAQYLWLTRCFIVPLSWQSWEVAGCWKQNPGRPSPKGQGRAFISVVRGACTPRGWRGMRGGQAVVGVASVCGRGLG